MIKKSLITIFFISVVLATLFISPIHAQNADDVSQVTKGVISGLVESVNDSILSPLFGDRELFTKLLFFTLFYMIIYSIVGQVFASKSKWITIGISVIVSILAIFFLPANFVNAIRTQYGAIGAAILSIIPFIIFLVFTIRVQSALVARIAWVFFVIYYFALYLYLTVTSGSGFISAETIPYLFSMVGGIIIFFFMGPIREALFLGEMGAIKEEGTRVASRAKLLHKLQRKELDEAYGEGGEGTGV